MNREEYQSLFELEEEYWWFQGMRQITSALLDTILESPPLTILDAGCGTGFMISWLRSTYAAGGKVVGLDLSKDALEYSRRRGEKLLVQANVSNLPLPCNTFDLVVSFEVLDWFSPDTVNRPVAELARVLKPGGFLLIRLPALQSLYSSHDRAIRTAHRYTERQMANCLEAGGLSLVRVTYANTILLPIAAVYRWVSRSRHGAKSDVRPLPKGLAWLGFPLRIALSLEAAWLRRTGWGLPLGLSVVGIARKPPQGA